MSEGVKYPRERERVNRDAWSATFRRKVPTGWQIREIIVEDDDPGEPDNGFCVSAYFQPDPRHDWDLE